jgi:alkaline phosphatase D
MVDRSTTARVNRRHFMSSAAALGATALWASRAPAASRTAWQEARDLYPQGVASGDPEERSVVLWTRRPFPQQSRAQLTVEVSLDPDFHAVVATARADVTAESDWTCRALVGGLKPSTVYWYRFTDDTGGGSRVGRTITAPRRADTRPVRFAFVSCQSVNEGAQNSFRRMIWDDQHASPDQRLGFVLHLGDFIYEVVEYPDEVPHRYDRTVFDIGRIPDARKVGNFHVPTTLEGYRMVYRAHIDDPDIQDARAYFPFVCIGDNHEFSWQGWQSFIKYGGKTEPAQQLRVAANQAWWEYIPSRVSKASGADPDRFGPPPVVDAAIATLDDHGLGDEPNNLAAIGCMTGYRSVQYGAHVDIVLTDLHSYAMEDPTSRSEAAAFDLADFPDMLPQETLQVLDAGRSYDDNRPPDEITLGATAIPNYRKHEPVFTVLGDRQKAWLKQQLVASKATWKIWAATNGTLDMRTDPQNLPAGLTVPWPGKGYATFGGGDFSAALSERAELYDLVRSAGIAGFVTVSGDRHSFWAGYAAKALPPDAFEPVGISFITGSISAPGMVEALEHGMKGHPLRPLFVADLPGGTEATVNLLVKRGVKSALEYARSGDIGRARAATNPDLSPHLAFVDMGGHGHSIVTAGPEAVEVEFVCIPRPVARAEGQDGGPLRYRVRHRASRWKAGERPKLEQHIVSGDPKLSV